MVDQDFEKAIEQVNASTLYNLLPLWLDNIRLNMPRLVNGAETISPLQRLGHGKKAVVVGRGPSLFKKNHLKLLASSKFDGFVVASDGALGECLENGVKPFASMTVDGNREKIWRWFLHDLKDVNIVVPVTVDKKVVDVSLERGGNVYWYIPMLDEGTEKVSFTGAINRMLFDPERPCPVISAGGNAGAAAWYFAMLALEVEEVALIGMDMGYHDDTKMEELHYHDNLIKSLGVEKTAQMYQIHKNPFMGTTCIVDPIFETYRRTFLKYVTQVKGKTVNCTEGGCLFGEGIEQMRFEDWLKAGR